GTYRHGWQGQCASIEENLVRKYQKGRYDHAKAPKLWRYLVDNAAKDYCREHGCTKKLVFPGRVLNEVAQRLADDFQRDLATHGGVLKGNPRKPPAVAFDDTYVGTWFERDRQHVELLQKGTDRTLIEWWDEEVSEAVEDGFLNPRDYHRSAYEYAVYIGAIRDPSGRNPRARNVTAYGLVRVSQLEPFMKWAGAGQFSKIHDESWNRKQGEHIFHAMRVRGRRCIWWRKTYALSEISANDNDVSAQGRP